LDLDPFVFQLLGLLHFFVPFSGCNTLFRQNID